jgi:hypothetical protein
LIVTVRATLREPADGVRACTVGRVISMVGRGEIKGLAAAGGAVGAGVAVGAAVGFGVRVGAGVAVGADVGLGAGITPPPA